MRIEPENRDSSKPEELGGQICADLFESDGWEVKFAGGGVPDDEVLKLTGEYRPDVVPPAVEG